MPAAVIGGVATLGSAAIGAVSASKAAKAQEKSAKSAQDTQLKMYEMSRQDLAPYSDVGKEGLYSLADLYGLKTPNNPNGGEALGDTALAAFRRSPDYQVAKKEGIGALDQSAAARGNLLSGGQQKRVMEYGAQLGDKYFSRYADRLQGIAGMGENAASRTGSAALQTGQGIAGSQMAAGEAAASGYVGAGNAIAGGVSALGTDLAAYAAKSAYKQPETLY